jgi:hypothetical protein
MTKLIHKVDIYDSEDSIVIYKTPSGFAVQFQGYAPHSERFCYSSFYEAERVAIKWAHDLNPPLRRGYEEGRYFN